MTATRDQVEEAARLLRQSAAERVPCAPVRHILGDATVADAYAVQRLNADAAQAAGRRVAGWKVGLTNPVVQRQLGVDQPDFGPIYADDEVGDGLPVPPDRLLQPRVEAEVAFVFDRDLPHRPVTTVDVLRATAFVAPAIEIVDSRVADWDITIVDTVADRASAGMHVVGPRPTLLGAVDLRTASMRMTARDELVAEGSGAGCLGHPVNAVVWLANTLVGLGQPLQAGDLILSGALGPMAPAKQGTTYLATIDGLGTVRAMFGEED